MNKKYLLDEERIPRQWYNITADFPEPPAPPLHPGTLQPAGPDDLAPLFPMGLIAQEASVERFIPIPDEVRDIYRIWRPTPLVRATGLEKAIGTSSSHTSPRRPAPASGAPPWRWPARCSASTCRSTWSR